MSKVIDYSWARPGAQNIKNAGYDGVIRYLSYDTTGKTITKAEIDDLVANGLQVGLVWESTANRAKSGRSAGFDDATEALRQANALGHSGALYFAVDYDAPETDQPVINEYFQGVASVIGLSHTAGYGGYWVIKRLFDAGLISFGWQTLAWSGTNREARAHLFQDGLKAFGGGADVNEVLKAEWGQSGISASPFVPAPPAPPVQHPATQIYKVVSGDTLSGIAAKFGIGLGQLESLNPQIKNPNLIYAGEVINITGSSVQNIAPAPSGKTYLVRSGNTLSGIASMNGLTLAQIEAKNPQIKNFNLIYAGEVVNI